MTTSYRNIFLLACCQALLLTNASGLIAMNGLVGYSLVETKTIATLGATTYVLGSALSTMPMSLWMAKVGRRRGFMTGALINIGGCALAVLALSLASFALYCIATAVIGIYNAVGLQYRFAAAEVATRADRARAISLVLAGGIGGGFLGPHHGLDRKRPGRSHLIQAVSRERLQRPAVAHRPRDCRPRGDRSRTERPAASLAPWRAAG